MLRDKITEASKAAMRSGEKSRLAALRLLLAEVTQQEVDTRKTLDDAAVQGIIAKMIKKGRDAAAQFKDAGRDDLAEKELSEITVFEEFMPQQLSADEVSAAIAQAIEATGATGIRDMGKVMGHLKGSIAGRADMGAVSAQVKAQLANG
ncbi:MAG: GatB/YqeY domain-containing protein [Gammaproteobacteria bacterium]